MPFREVKKGDKPKFIDKLQSTHHEEAPSLKQDSHLSTPAILSLGFLFLITVGTILLLLPMATIKPINLLTAAFTATSAVTVTGIKRRYVEFYRIWAFGDFGIGSVWWVRVYDLCDFGTHRAARSHGAIQFGCRPRAARHQYQPNRQYRQISIKNCAGGRVFWFIGLTLCLLPLKDLETATYEAFFLSVAAFNNSGFTLTSNSLMAYVHQPMISFIISWLVIIGGLGFLVTVDIFQKRRWQKFTIHTKSMIVGTLILNVIACLLFWLLERNNVNTLGEFSRIEQWFAAWFMAVKPRSSGFNNVDYTQINDSSTLLTFILMFIGGGSMSTGGGIKIGTFVVIIASTLAYLRQRPQVTIFNRAIPDDLVKKSFAVISISILTIFLGSLILAALEPDGHMINIFFEVISASATVGLSRNYTATLSEASQCVIIFMMYMGRLGPLTLAYFIATPKPTRIKYPETHTLVG